MSHQCAANRNFNKSKNNLVGPAFFFLRLGHHKNCSLQRAFPLIYLLPHKMKVNSFNLKKTHRLHEHKYITVWSHSSAFFFPRINAIYLYIFEMVHMHHKTIFLNVVQTDVFEYNQNTLYILPMKNARFIMTVTKLEWVTNRMYLPTNVKELVRGEGIPILYEYLQYLWIPNLQVHFKSAHSHPLPWTIHVYHIDGTPSVDTCPYSTYITEQF